MTARIDSLLPLPAAPTIVVQLWRGIGEFPFERAMKSFDALGMGARGGDAVRKDVRFVGRARVGVVEEPGDDVHLGRRLDGDGRRRAGAEEMRRDRVRTLRRGTLPHAFFDGALAERAALERHPKSR